jgi:hypothetical protein
MYLDFVNQHIKLYEVHGTRVTPLLVESLLRNFLSIFPDNSPFALPLSPCNLAADVGPALSFAVFVKAPFLELSLVLTLAVVV